LTANTPLFQDGAERRTGLNVLIQPADFIRLTLTGYSSIEATPPGVTRDQGFGGTLQLSD
jgi:hypothetical protein